ncbi:hypothetical protein PINS_up007649 [Pythium insidiosum]|nr:hypothetical protein PINS_up007649 [Pythium insidiosum]
MRRRLAPLVLLWLVAVAWTVVQATGNASAPTPSPTLSGCQTCAATGNCNLAYLDGPGQFCGNWLDQSNQRQRCCCPLNADCKVSNYACKCTLKATPRPTATITTGAIIGSAVGSAIFLACFCGIGWVIFKSCIRPAPPASVKAQAVPVPVAVPAAHVVPAPYGAQPYGAPPYGAPPPGAHPATVYPGGAPVYNYGHGTGYGGGGMGSSFAAGLGTVASMAAGMVLANAVLDGMDGGGFHHRRRLWRLRWRWRRLRRWWRWL